MNYLTCGIFDINKKVYIRAISSNELKMPEHNPDIFTLILICHGNVKIKIKDTIYTINAPSAICLDELQNICIDSCNHLETKIIYFNPTFINKNMTINTIRSSSYDELVLDYSYLQLRPFLENNFEKRIFNLNIDSFQKICMCFNNCQYQLENQPDLYWSCRARSYFMDIIQCLERIYYNYGIYNEGTKYEDEIKLLEKILSHINSHLDTPLSLDLISNEYKTYSKIIESIFKRHLNMTFYQYIQDQKFECICYYLRFTELQAKEIALRVGISSSQNLCKFFKNMSGKSPNQFRKEELAARKEQINRSDYECHNNNLSQIVTA